MPRFDLAVFLWLPAELRLKRLREREIGRHGPGIGDPSHPAHEQHRGFLEWAAAYDEGLPDMRSRAMHETWMAALPCPLLRIEADRSVGENLSRALRGISRLSA